MSKEGTSKKAVNTKAGSVTLREESIGKKKQSHVNAKSMLKLEHLKNLAIWASGETFIPSLGAFFGQRLAASAESLDIPLDTTLCTCQRCETILQAGYNCSVRSEKNKRKERNLRKKLGIHPKNCVVYKCQFCSHSNLQRGTSRGYMKYLYLAKATTSRVDHTEPAVRKSEQTSGQFNTFVARVHRDNKKGSSVHEASRDLAWSRKGLHDRDNSTEVIISSEVVADEPTTSPATPLSTVAVASLLDSNRKKRNRTSCKKKVEPQDVPSVTDTEKTIPSSSKRKRKSWTSLKGIAEGEGSSSRKFSNLSVSFIL